MSGGADADRAARLDELNKQAFIKNWRRIMDDGLGDPELYQRSALPGLLAELRANAEAVYGDGATGRRAPRPS